MNRSTQILFLVMTLTSTLSMRSADELRLMGEVDGRSFPFGGVQDEHLLLQDEDQLIRAPSRVRWHLEGDLKTHRELIRWAPYYTIGRTPEPQRAGHPDKPFKAISSLVLVELGGPEPNKPAPDWPSRLAQRSVAVSAWLIDGQISETLVSPSPRGSASVGFGFFLTAHQAQGQAIHLLWSDGEWAAPEPLFSDPAINRALVDVLLGDPARTADLTDSALAAKSRDNLTLVQYAVDAGAMRALDQFASIDTGIWRQLDEHGANLLHRAASKGRLPVAQTLIAERVSRTAKSKYRDSPLDKAINSGHLPMVNELLAAGAMPRGRNDRTAAMRLAIFGGFVDIAEALLANGATFNFKSTPAAQLLIERADNGYMEMTAWLAMQGVDVNYQDGSAFVLFAAAAKGDGAVAKALIKAGANPNRAKANGFSPLMVAAEARNSGFAAELIAAKANVNARLESGATTLHIAAHANAADVVQLLLDAGADIDARNTHGLSALDAALLNGSGSAAQVLAQRGARIDLGSAHSQRLLEAALRWDIPDPLAAAMNEGWPADSTFAGIWPAARLAQLFGAEKCEALLVEAGATMDDNQPMPVVSASELDDRVSVVRAVMPTDPRPPEESYPKHTVRVEIIIDSEGRPLFPKIVDADDPRLGAAAQQVITQWRFSPPRRNGQPMATQVVLPLNFPGSGNRIFEITELNEKPQPVSRSRPIYPFELKRNGIEGSVRLVFVVDAEGNTRDVRVEQSTDARFEEAAIQAVSEWRFEPGRVAGRPVAARVRQRLDFTIN